MLNPVTYCIYVATYYRAYNNPPAKNVHLPSLLETNFHEHRPILLCQKWLRMGTLPRFINKLPRFINAHTRRSLMR